MTTSFYGVRITKETRNVLVARLIPGLLIALSCWTASAVGQGLTFVAADDGFFSGMTNISPLSAFDLTGAIDGNDGSWHIRDMLGYQESSGNSFIYEATGNVDTGAGDTGEDVPEVMQTISGLTPGASYKLYAVYWTNPESWPIQTGVTSGNLTYYDAFGVKEGATAGVPTGSATWSSPPTIAGVAAFSEADRTSYLGYAGTVQANSSGEAAIFVDDIPGGGDSSGTRTWWDGAAYIPAEFDISLSAVINRDSGQLTVSNSTGSGVSFTSLSVTSASQALDASSWLSITDNYDSGVLDTDPWEITAPTDAPLPSFTGDLSEMESAGAAVAGATLANGSSVDLGSVWQDTQFEDVEVALTLTSGTVLTIPTSYTGTAHLAGDFDNSGAVGLSDYLILRDNLHTDLTTLGQAEAYLMGDMTGDLLVNFADFTAFRGAYPGNFEALLAQIPEPNSVLLVVASLLALGTLRSVQRHLTLQLRFACDSTATSLSLQTTPYRSHNMMHSRFTTFFALLSAGSLLLFSSAQGADVTLTNGDGFGTSSFNTAGLWSNTQAPSAGNDYFTGAYNLRTPADGGSYTFAGDSLTVSSLSEDTTEPIWDPGERLEGGMSGFWFKGTGDTGTITINNFILDGGLVVALNGSTDIFNLDGNVTVTDDSYVYAQQGPINFLAPVHGSAAIINPGSDEAGNTLTFLSPNSTFTGNLVNDGRFALADGAVMNFSIGGNGVNNAISGAGPETNLDGKFVFDVSGASSTLGDSWSVVSADNVVYGDTFDVDGFFEYATGTWISGDYRFEESTGMLSVVTPPDLLTMRINSTSGAVSILNDSESTSFDLNYYEIRSAGGALSLSNWASIDGDAPASETSWEKAGGSSANLIAETNLLGMESLAPTDSVSLGGAFAGPGEDLEFYYGVVGSPSLFRGYIEYVSGGQPGDFDGDGDVDGLDFLAWQRNPSVGNLADWQANYGASLSASLSSVPEPMTLLLALAIVPFAIANRCRERGI